MNALIVYFAKQKLFGNLLTIFILLMGLASVFLIKREVFPNVSFDVITITTIYPGASGEEVEKLITNQIEQDLTEVDGIKKLRSVSVENRSLIIAQLDPDQTNEEDAKSDIQGVVDKLDLPSGAERPMVLVASSKQNPIIQVAISSNNESMTEEQLRSIVLDIEKELERIPGVARAAHLAIRDREIQVEASPQKLAQYRLSLDDLVNALKRQNLSIPAGSIEPVSIQLNTENPEKLVKTVGEFKSLEDVEKTVVRSNDLGKPILVKDVANVKYGLEKPTVITRTNGKASLSLTVLKKENADAIRMVDSVKERIDSLKSKYPVDISYIQDFSEYIRNRISILTGNLMVGLVLVLGILTLVLPFRIALLVGIGIPFSFLGTMAVFYNQNYSINLISLLGLIIVSGMLVDDAIVVTDNCARKLDEGMDPETAAIEGTKEIWPALTASVLTTVTAFLPMMFMSGIFGKFVKQIPLGVVIALMISLFQGFFILPQHFASFIHKKDVESPKKNGPIRNALKKIQDFWDLVLIPQYIKIITVLLKRRYLVATAMGILFVGSIIFAKTGMKFILFPPDGVEAFFVRVQAPSGTSLATTAERMRPIEKIIQGIPKVELRDFTTTVGIIQNDPNDPFTKRGSEYGQIAVFLSPETERDRKAQEIIDDLRSQTGTPEGFIRVTFERVNSGPPVGKPISLGIRGESYEEILKAIEDVKTLVKSIEGTKDITDTFIPGKEEIRILVNGAEAAAAGLSVAQIGTTVRAAFDGIVATSIQELNEQVDIRVSFPKQAKANEMSLRSIFIPNMQGALVPLTSVAKFGTGSELSSYDHENGNREIKVNADVDINIISAVQANQKIKTLLPELQKKHPSILIDFGGEDADTQESLASLGRAFGLAFMGILFIMILTFKNILQPLLLLLTIPMGIVSVIWTFFFHGIPLSFMGMLGIIALAGVIVNNAIVFVDFVNQARSQGVENEQSILDSAKMRIRPIFLTTITTVFGLLPTAYGIGGLDRFVMPIALALGWGLLFGSLLTAFAFPSAIAILDDLIAFFSRMSKKLRKA